MKHIFLLLLLLGSTVFSQDKNISVISLEKVNVVYRGITNPIKIAVPGAKSFKAEAPGTLEKVDSLGNYSWNVTSVSGTKRIVKITAKMPDDSIIHEEKEFEIRPISHPRVYINGDYEETVYEMTHSQFSVAEFKITIDNLLYTFTPKDSLYFIPESFVLVFPKQEELTITGNKMDEYAKMLIKDLPVGSIIYLKNIHQYNPHEYYLPKLNALKIKIVDGPIEEITTPEPLISLRYQNFVYRVIDNELEIAVPGAKSFKVSAPGLTEQESGKYQWNVTQISTTTTTLDFEIITENDSIFYIKKEFYVRDVPKMIATLNTRGCDKCIVELAKNDVKEAKIGVSFSSYLDVRLHPMRVKQYTLVLPEGYRYTVYQDKFSESAQKMILQYPVGTIFKVTDVDYTFHGYGPPQAELKFMLVD